MAEGLAKVMLAKRLGVASEALENAGVRVRSAGVYASAGSPATPEAVDAVSAMGADLLDHTARRLTLDEVQDADVIYAMTQSHAQAVLAIVPTAADKLTCLDPQGDITDPIGAGPEVYRATAKMIGDAITLRIAERFSNPDPAN